MGVGGERRREIICFAIDSIIGLNIDVIVGMRRRWRKSAAASRHGISTDGERRASRNRREVSREIIIARRRPGPKRCRWALMMSQFSPTINRSQ